MTRINEQRVPLSADWYMVVQYEPARDRYVYELRRTPRAKRVRGPARHRKGNFANLDEVIMHASAALHDLTDGRYTEWKAADVMRKGLKDPRARNQTTMRNYEAFTRPRAKYTTKDVQQAADDIEGSDAAAVLLDDGTPYRSYTSGYDRLIRLGIWSEETKSEGYRSDFERAVDDELRQRADIRRRTTNPKRKLKNRLMR